ncbi:emp24/gp25L/p24/GOLD [Gracilaria domingensis]|nr:emp24/gp25L/p24/GOLD [Gracilaria domingensis]
MEHVPRGSTLYAEVRTSSTTNPLDIDVFVTNERGVVVAHKAAVSDHKFTIPGSAQTHSNPALEGYRFCFLNQIHPHQVVTKGETRVSFNVRFGAGGKGVQRVELLKRDQIETTNDKIRNLEDDLNRVLVQMDDLKEQEDILSRIVIIAIGALQFDALKATLRQRKVIP